MSSDGRYGDHCSVSPHETDDESAEHVQNIGVFNFGAQEPFFMTNEEIRMDRAAKKMNETIEKLKEKFNG